MFVVDCRFHKDFVRVTSVSAYSDMAMVIPWDSEVGNLRTRDDECSQIFYNTFLVILATCITS